MRKVLIGLDIDGVMNPSTLDNDGKITKTSVYYLNRVLEICQDVDILITSCWGNASNTTTDALVESGFKYPERIIDYVEIISYSNNSSNRTTEVELWMENQSIYTDIICVDDCLGEFSYIGKYDGATKNGIVLCEANIGLSEKTAYELIVKLQGHTLRYWG